MKLIIAIIHDEDNDRVSDILNAEDIRATFIASTGSFLRSGRKSRKKTQAGKGKATKYRMHDQHYLAEDGHRDDPRLGAAMRRRDSISPWVHHSLGCGGSSRRVHACLCGNRFHLVPHCVSAADVMNAVNPIQWLRPKAAKQPARSRLRISQICQAACASTATSPASQTARAGRAVCGE